MKCPNCGREIPEDSNFCEFCGAQLKQSNKNPKTLWIACAVALFAIVAGGVIYHQYNAHLAAIAEANQRAEEARLEKEEAEKEAERAKYIAQGYIDLGLPSGTLWKNTTEAGYYSFEQAKNRFGDGIPTKNQWDELIEYCQWTWSGWNSRNDEPEGYTITGPNGSSFFLPNLGFQMPNNGDRYGFGQAGHYWTITTSNQGYPYVLYTYRTYYSNHNEEENSIATNEWSYQSADCELSVRLVYK